MNKLRLGFCAVLFVALTLTLASQSQAQLIRTYVSGVGDDANPCSRTAPSKTFAKLTHWTQEDSEGSL
jgi:hypothetical protein